MRIREFIRRNGLWLVAVALLAGGARFYQLGEGVLRADELNRYLEGRSPVGLVEFWRDWSAPDQVPLQNVFCMWVARQFFPEVNEYSLRVPGAVLGVLTVLLLAGWVAWHYGRSAGIFLGIWLSLNPYHLHESREAYYYGMLMFNGACFSLFTLEMLVRLQRTKEAFGWFRWGGWTALTILFSASHMSTWIYAVVFGMALLMASLRLPVPARWKNLAGLAGAGVAGALVMQRWIINAVSSVLAVRSGKEVGIFFGDRFVDVAPRVLPMYLASFGWLGWTLLLLTLASAVWLWMPARAKNLDRRYRLLSQLTGASVLAMFLYIGIVGRGVAKETFFSSLWPVLLVWAAVTLWKAAQDRCARRSSAMTADRLMLAGTAAVFLSLAYPAWMIMNLDGKPTPYRQIREWLDRELPAGTTVVVDRWIEPWVEMDIYAPSNVFVTFTIPDEPFRQYVDSDWRGVTRRAFETGEAQAFLRLLRNHEKQMGEWEWPQRFFKQRAEIVNERALWLRRNKYSVMSALHEANSNRVVSHVFYNTDADWKDYARSLGKSAFLLFGAGWDHLKPWRMMAGWPEPLMQLLWIQAGLFEEDGRTLRNLDEVNRMPQDEAMRHLNRGRWADYWVPGAQSRLRIFNLTEEALTADLHLTGVAMTGPVRAQVGDQSVEYPPGLMRTHRISVVLQPGENEIPVRSPEGQLLLVRRAAL